jgi:hypothetical protein
MAHAHLMLDTQGHKHRLRTCNTFSFSAATTIARTCPTVTFIRTLCVVVILLATKFYSPTNFTRDQIFRATKYYSVVQIKGDELGVYFNLQWRHGEMFTKV